MTLSTETLTAILESFEYEAMYNRKVRDEAIDWVNLYPDKGLYWRSFKKPEDAEKEYNELITNINNVTERITLVERWILEIKADIQTRRDAEYTAKFDNPDYMQAHYEANEPVQRPGIETDMNEPPNPNDNGEA